MNILAGTALALVLATPASAAPQASTTAPAQRDYSTPGSMTKPSTPIMPTDTGLRFRSTLPDTGTGLQPRSDVTPLAPAAPAAKIEPAATQAAPTPPPAAAAAKPAPQAPPAAA
ncbi:MAG TPA: hypothetical protein VIU42_16820, partial [Xanthobacteraceae bacterium]